MSEFKREERFIVIKRKHLSAESRTHDSLEQELRVWLDRHLVPTSECVVVESDWPEYETVWSMIAARIEGRLTPYQVLEQQVHALRQHKTDYIEAAEGTRRALEAEAQALREERDRIERNRDMWKGQCERQAEKLAALRARVVVPDGYAIVPVELTRDMWVAVNKEDDRAYAGACDHGAQFDWLWKAAIDAAPRLNGKAVSEGLLRKLLELIEHGDFSEGHCMCGSAVDSHGIGDGHAPVDAGEYYAGQVMEELRALLAAAPQPAKGE